MDKWRCLSRCRRDWPSAGAEIGTAVAQKFRGQDPAGRDIPEGGRKKEGVPRSSHKAARRITPGLSFGLADTPEYTGSASPEFANEPDFAPKRPHNVRPRITLVTPVLRSN